MKKTCIFLITLGSFCFSYLSFAQNYMPTDPTLILTINSYNDVGSGDVTFQVQDPIPECPHGYWLTTTDSGFNANFSMILSAYQAKNTVKIWGLPDQLWSGSSGMICKLYSVVLE